MMNEYYETDNDGRWKVKPQPSGVIVRVLEEPSQEYIDRVFSQPVEPEPEPRDYLAEIDDLSARVEVLEAKVMSA